MQPLSWLLVLCFSPLTLCQTQPPRDFEVLITTVLQRETLTPKIAPRIHSTTANLHGDDDRSPQALLKSTTAVTEDPDDDDDGHHVIERQTTSRPFRTKPDDPIDGGLTILEPEGSTSKWEQTVIIIAVVASGTMLVMMSFLMFQRKRTHRIMDIDLASPPPPSSSAGIRTHTATRWIRARGFHPLHTAVVLDDLPMLKQLLESNAQPSCVAESRLVGSSAPLEGVQIQTFSPPAWSEASMSSHTSDDDAPQSVASVLRPINVLDAQQRTPLHWAVAVSRLQCLKLLLSHGADPNFQDASGNTTLHVAVLNADIFVESLSALIRAGVDVNVRNYEGSTPLHLAASCDMPDKIGALLRAAANVTQLDETGCPPLIRACLNDNASALSALLADKRVDADIRDTSGRSGLHRAAQVNAIACLSVLVDHNVRLQDVDYIGNTALHYALRESNIEAAILLLTAAHERGKLDLLLAQPGAEGLTCQDMLTNLNNTDLNRLLTGFQTHTFSPEKDHGPAGSKEWRRNYMRKYRAEHQQQLKRSNAELSRVSEEHARLQAAVDTLKQEAKILRSLLESDT
eukprot:TRINITY_DN9390_c0_g1_i1.p2 TRINITY_DN9390_c0_g1~~TRINITY_DN9390_c0_g1_i1.p2  ORF type:complete len:572 (+),score=123.54 TRINITY_DN9390_c0_g1_i1:2958-4673(+)